MRKKYHLYSSMPMLGNHKAYAEIDSSALKHNYKTMLDHIHKENPNTVAICVLKADAYGHGAKNCCRALLEEGCRHFAVSSIEEAIDIRSVCDEMRIRADVLILGYTLPSQAALLAKYDIITSIVDADYAKELSREALAAGVTVKCHVKLDTGMNRIGFSAKSDAEIETSARAIAEIFEYPKLKVCGMFTHFAKADETLEPDSTDEMTKVQFERFKQLDAALLELGVDVKFRHVCNSAAAMRFPEYHLDACRLGITLYGTHSSRYVDSFGLLPVMKLCTVISHIHTLSKGETVSYGGTYTAEDDRLIATLPIGYADGFVRAYSGAIVTVLTDEGPKKAAIRGRICMDQCMIDITGTSAKVGDKVVLFGNSPSELTELAKMANTIEYESLCLVTSRVPRIEMEPNK
ncbi:MAG: alanine racemase [Clostridia bacterium]|nr:alanine racemase [Clostridia bacterium]MBO7249680.1 alanine racemase [Clostridia bacterium]